MTNLYNDSADEGLPSKSEKKRQMDALQDLGKALTELSTDKLKKIELDEDLRTAVLEHKRLTSHGAKKRQEQYIGKLMRGIDPEPIRKQLDIVNGDSSEHAAWLLLLERWRNRLMADDAMLATFISEHPSADVQQMRTTIRNARKELADKKPPKAYRVLFQTLKEFLPEPGKKVLKEENT
jgi:ribosome-associated protein